MGGTPIEMVSVLMTDLVDSTALEERAGPAGADALRGEHLGILRAAIAVFEGREVKTLGDGLMVVFRSASQAVRCAVEMQQGLEHRNRSAEEPLAVRIGVSVGDVAVEDGDFFGSAVIEAARLCDRADGGQIFVTDHARHLGGGRGELHFEELGGLVLKGMAEPVPCHLVRWEPLAAAAVLPQRLSEPSGPEFVGRTEEQHRLITAWERAREGALSLALVAGEAGVGKTRLASQLAADVHEMGATVLYGRCEEDVGIPYQPWAQALRHLVANAPPLELQVHAERYGGELARLAPMLSERLPGLAPPVRSDPDAERYLLFTAVAGALRGSSGVPTLVILDDLQWADQPTLSLLRHVVGGDDGGPMMIVGTYRDTDLNREHPLTALLADLHREREVTRVSLSGLQREEVGMLVDRLIGRADDGQEHELAVRITRESAGNPFFALELLRHLRETGQIRSDDGAGWVLVSHAARLGLPQSVREVVGRRVDRLGGEVRMALSAASAIGRDFDLSLLATVLDQPEEALLALLERAAEASLLRETGKRAGQFTFTHALVEFSLYEELGAARRAVTHRRIAEALEQRYGDAPGEHLGELAGHWAAAVVDDDASKAIDYASRAGERALAQLAPGEAVRQYGMALRLVDLGRTSDPARRCALLIGLGEGQRQVGDPAFRQTLLDAARLARERGDVEQLCRSVLANTRGWSARTGQVDAERVGVLEAAAEALPRSDPRRARVLALLALELHFGHDPARCREIAAEAVSLARGAVEPIVLAHALLDASWAIWLPETLAEREGLLEEADTVANGLEDPWLRFWAASRWAMLGLETGDRVKIETGLAKMRPLRAHLPQPSIVYALLTFESTWAFVQGDLAGAERMAIEAVRVAAGAGDTDAELVASAQIFQIRYVEGRLGESVERIVQAAREERRVGTWKAGAAAALTAAGRPEELRALAETEDFAALPPDQLRSQALLLWGESFARLGEPRWSSMLYEMIEPFERQFAAASGAVVFGSNARVLGMLADSLGRPEDADAHFRTAIELETGMGAPMFVARTRLDWARCLIARGRADELRLAGELLSDAAATATSLGAEVFAQEIDGVRLALTPPYLTRGVPRSVSEADFGARPLDAST